MEDWILRHRAGIYVLVNVGVMLAGAFGVMSQNASVGTATYVCLLFVLCSVPVLWMERINDRYALLAAFTGTFYLLFGGLSLNRVLFGSGPDSVPEVRDDFMTVGQLAVLLAAALVVTGYRAGAAMVPRAARNKVPSDWSNAAVLGIGLGCTILGSCAYAYYAIVVTPVNSLRATAQGFENMGPALTFAVMLGQLVQPLGLLMLAYGYARSRTPLWLGLVAVMVLSQLVLGFITDTKGIALLGILLVAFTQALWNDKLPKGWIAAVVVFAVLIFPVFQAARVERGERGLDRQQAFEHVFELLALSLESENKVNEGKPGVRAQTFLERSSGEAMLEPIFEHVGTDTPFLDGRSLVALPYAFIPRLLIPDKADLPVGQLYNHVFLHAPSDDFTYISFSVLGEFYWNFGWTGVVVGMLLWGILLGYTGAKSSLAEVRSLPRLLILLISIKMLCLGFGGSIGISLVVWMRALAAVGLLQLMFGRRAATAAASPAALAKSGQVVPHAGASGPLFPNIMR